MTKSIVGIIGGSGVYHLPGLADLREEKVSTPWGEPSDALRFGKIGTTEVVFLPRHGRGHRLSPSGINYRANIYALKQAGVTDIISVSACGSFKAELNPGLFVLVDQFVDRTYRRANPPSSAMAASRMSRWRIRSRRCCSERLAAAAEAERIGCREGRHLCRDGRAAILLARRIARLSELPAST